MKTTPALLAVLFALVALVAAGGCNVLGFATQALPAGTDPPRHTLAGKRVAIMVWADFGVRVDYPGLQQDLAATVQRRLEEAATKGKQKALKDVSFPLPAATVVRFQTSNPQYSALPVEQLAADLKVDQLVYVELTTFGTRSQQVRDLYRGAATFDLKVGDAAEKRVVYEETQVEAVFPKRTPPEGTIRGDDRTFYAGTIARAADLIAARFLPTPRDGEE